MTFWALSGLINGITSTILGNVVYFRNRKNVVNVSYGLFCLSIAVWSYAYFLWQISLTESAALLWCRWLMAGAVFIPVCYLHHILTFLKLHTQKKTLIISGYLFGIISFFLSFTSLFVKSVSPKLWFKFWPDAGVLYLPFLFVWFLFVIYGIILISKALFNSTGIARNQIRYVLIATVIGWGGGATNYFLWFDIRIPPIGNIFVSIYVAIVAYAIIKYRLMDINMVVTRIGVFIFVYTLVLGIPFGIGIKYLGLGSWLFPVSLMAVFATLGPFIYLYIQRRAEDRLLQEEKKVQELLTRASIGMITVRDLQKLLKLIIDVVVKNLKVDNTAIYLLENDLYVLKVSEKEYKNHTRIESDDPLIQRLKELKQPIIYEEIKLLSESQQNNEENLHEIVRQMGEMPASVIIPTIIEDILLGFIVVGERTDKGAYSADLINVLTVVGNQVALAIENAIFYEETGKNLAEKFHESRLKSLGTLGTGIAHQMHNRFNVITFGGEMLLQTIKSLNADKISTEDLKKVFAMVIKNVEKMVGSAFRGAEIADAIKNYAKKADAAPSAVLFKAIVKNSMELLYVKQNSFKFKFIEDYPQEVFLWVNFSNLQEIIFNAVDNSCDAMALKKKLCDSGDLNIKDYDPQVVIRGKIIDKNFTFEIEDNGLGFEEERLKKGVDVPFFTTKGAGKGTGMGIHMMAHYAKQNGGDLKIESEHAKYTKIILAVPLATDEQIAAAKLKENMNKEGNGNGNSQT